MQLSQHWLKLGIATLLIVGGGAASTFGFGLVEGAITAKNWPMVEGYIKTTKLVREARGKRKITTYHLSITYGYIVDKIAYTGDRYSFGEGAVASERFRRRSRAIAEQEKYPVGSKITVYYNPEEPNFAVLKPGLNIGTFVPLALGLFACSGGLRLMFSVLRNPT